jgi:hypothetical protein
MCASTVIGAVTFFGKLNAEQKASFTAGIDVPSGAPSGESVWIKVGAKDDYALVLHAILDALRALVPSSPAVSEHLAIFEDADKGRVVFFPYPRDADCACAALLKGGHYRNSSVASRTKHPSGKEITPEMIERAAAELGYWTSEEHPSRLAAARILRAGLGIRQPSLDSL